MLMAYFKLLIVHLMLFEKERQEHEHSTIMDNPPDINISISKALMVAGIE